MNRILLTIVVLCFALVSAVPAQVLDHNGHLCANGKAALYGDEIELGKAYYPGDTDIDVTYYKLDLTLTESLEYISGVTTISAKVTAESIAAFFIDLQNSFTVNDVKLEGVSLTYTHSNAQIIIYLPRYYTEGEEFTIVIVYEGVPGSSGFGSYETGIRNSKPVAWTLSEPYGASDWWPNKDNPADKADSSDVWVTVEAPMYAVSNGKLLEIEAGDGNFRTFKWKNSYPITPYLISLAIADYDIYTNEFVDGDKTLDVIHYNYEGTLSDNRKADLDLTVSMLEIFSELFGEYPFMSEKYGHAEFGWGGGMEHQTVSSMGAFNEGIVSHELAHQWFGDKITCADWHHIWLNEGFATYCEALFYEFYYGKNAYHSEMNFNMQYALSAQGTIYVQSIGSVSSIFNGARSYSKGSCVLHMLRKLVGDDDFFAILNTYANDPEVAYAAAVTEDFQRVAEDVSGMDLDFFFQQWIYGENYPKYNIEWSYTNRGDDTYDVSVNLNQQTNSNPAYFIAPVDIQIWTEGGDTTFTVMNNQQSQTFDFVVNARPTELVFDPDNWLLDQVFEITNVDDVKKIPNAYTLKQNYPNPFNPSTSISFTLPKNELVNIKVYDILGNEITELTNRIYNAGTHTVDFNAAQVEGGITSGVYIYKITAGEFVSSKKMMLLK